MYRREFVSILVGSGITLNLPLIENKENPKKLPVAEFDENGEISNYDEIIANVPWERKTETRKIRTRHCWIHETDSILSHRRVIIGKRLITRFWGEVELIDGWSNNGFNDLRSITLNEMPESMHHKQNVRIKTTIYKP